jgi:hypothetical protein
MVTGPTALPWSATFTGTGCNAWFGESHFASAAVTQRPNPLKEREVEEAAMPGQAESAPALPDVPRQLTLENCRLPRASPQPPIDKPESSHVFAEPTVGQKVARGNRKILGRCAEPVDGGSCLWKAEEKCGGN